MGVLSCAELPANLVSQGFDMRFNWSLNPSETSQDGAEAFAKFFLQDTHPEAILSANKIFMMLELCGHIGPPSPENISLLLYPVTKKEITIVESHARFNREAEQVIPIFK